MTRSSPTSRRASRTRVGLRRASTLRPCGNPERLLPCSGPRLRPTGCRCAHQTCQSPDRGDQGGRLARAAVRHALEQTEQQVSGPLERARETADEITTSAHREAEAEADGIRAKAAELLVNANAEADATKTEAEASLTQKLRRRRRSQGKGRSRRHPRSLTPRGREHRQACARRGR